MEKEQFKKLINAAFETGVASGTISTCEIFIDELLRIKREAENNKVNVSEEELKEIGKILQEEVKKDD